MNAKFRPLVKSEYLNIVFLISQPKHMLWVLNVVSTQKNRLIEHTKHM